MTRKDFIASLSNKPVSLAAFLRESYQIGPIPHHFDPPAENEDRAENSAKNTEFPTR